MDIWCNKSIAKDLNDYVDIVVRCEASSIFSVEKLKNLSDRMPSDGFCVINDIELEFYQRKPNSKTIPKISSFKISLINSLTSKDNIDFEINDPIEKCTFDIIVTGFCCTEDGVEFKNSWHLDKDEIPEGGSHKHTHPLYHFQYGGKKMETLETGGIMLMGAPRLPHPPMDIFLSIHFILNNYYNKDDDDFYFLKELFEDDDYIDILERAKERMWYPYFKGLNNDSNSHSELNLSNLFPLAV